MLYCWTVDICLNVNIESFGMMTIIMAMKWSNVVGYNVRKKDKYEEIVCRLLSYYYACVVVVEWKTLTHLCDTNWREREGDKISVTWLYIWPVSRRTCLWCACELIRLRRTSIRIRQMGMWDYWIMSGRLIHARNFCVFSNRRCVMLYKNRFSSCDGTI